METYVNSLLKKMKCASPENVSGFIGFDGFIDEVVYVVDKRLDEDHYERINYMKDYADRIRSGANLSINIEMVPIAQKIGGNGTIFANSLIMNGMNITYVGALGLPQIHPVYSDMAGKCHAVSISNPGHTDAIEFFDGKIISSKLEPLKAVSWSSLINTIGSESLIQLIENGDFAAFLNWSLVIHTTEIWENLLSEILPKLKSNACKKSLFIDLADPEKRLKKDIKKALQLIEKFSKYFRVILGLNKKEAYEIAVILGLDTGTNFECLSELLEYIKQHLNVDVVVIHPIEAAGAVTAECLYIVDGPYCKCPKLTTGAGDNFNAGFMLGQTLGFDIKESLLCGVANSGFYVREGRSPSYEELIHFIEVWKSGGLES